MDDTLTVIQSDRDAAADYINNGGLRYRTASDIGLGRHDKGRLVQAFARHRIAAQSEQDGWRDIASAPKDGTVIDVWCASEPGFRIPEVIWEDRYHAFFSNDAGVLADDISHWMPLPTPPEAGGGE